MRVFIALLFLFRLSTVFGQTRQELDSLTKVLEGIYDKDQVPRGQLDSIQNHYGYNSNQVREQWRLIKRNDSSNIQIVKSVLDNYGWLREQNTSKNAISALFLVIQHADLNFQVKYIDTLKERLKKGMQRLLNTLTCLIE